MVLVYACTLSKRLTDFKTLANKVSAIPGGENLALEKLRAYLEEETKRSTRKGENQGGEDDKDDTKKGANSTKSDKRNEKSIEISNGTFLFFILSFLLTAIFILSL